MSSLERTLTNIRRTPYQSAAAILVLTITFFVGILVSLITLGFYSALHYFETRPQVIVFFKNETPENTITQLKSQLESDSQVTQVTYIPQEEALDIYKQINQNDPLLLELVTSDILPASLEISTNTLDELKNVASSLEKADGVEEVALQTDVVDTLNRWLVGIRTAGVAFVSLLLFTSILIVMVIVGMKISGKQNEIKILELIGATRWYIQGPFLLEGAFYGFFASLLAFSVCLILLLYSAPLVLSFAGQVPLLPTSPQILSAILAGSLFTGVFIGTLGSWIAVKRFVKL